MGPDHKADTLQSRLYARLDGAPDSKAVAFYDRQGRFEWASVEQLHRRAGQLAAGLADAGVAEGDPCIIVRPSDEDSAHLIVAALLRGAVPLLVAPPVLQGMNSSLAEVLTRTVARTKARAVICDASLEGLGDQLRSASPATRFIFGILPLEGAADPPGRPRRSGADVAAMQLTSGTTGFPRVCVWTQRAVLAALEGMRQAMRLRDGDICFNWTPLYHDMGLVNNLFLALAHGMPLVMMQPHDFVRRPALWLRGLSDTGATITWAPNFGFALAAERIRDHELAGVRLDGVRGLWNAAERIHAQSVEAFRDRFAPYGLDPRALKTNFGCAENVGGATFSDPDGSYVQELVDVRALHAEQVARHVEPSANGHATVIVGVGRPYPGMRVWILSPTGEKLPDGHVGEIALDTPSRTEGYLDDPEATAVAIRDGLLCTGDLGYLRDGELFWVGRVRERINVRGKKLDPSDFEPILLDIPGLRKNCFAAFGVEDPGIGTERIVIVSEVKEAASEGPEELAGEIRRHVFDRLGLNVDDVALVREGTLTKTSSGKRRHVHFRELYMSGALAPFEWAGRVSSTEGGR